jgi:Ca2+-binding RTX toxin-like protein
VEYELLGLSEDVSKLMFSSNYETLDTAPDLYQVYLMNINDNSVEILSQTIDGISGNDASLLGVMDSIGSNYAYQTNATNLLADIPGILITDVEDASEIIGTSQSDTLQSTDGPDSISALAGNDSINLTADSTWSSSYAAQNVSNTNSVGTNEKITLTGLNRFSDVIDGGADVDTLNLTTGNDAFFIDDVYSAHHSSLTLSSTTQGIDSTARITNLEVINAGEGNDIVDLTSSNYILANAIEINGEAGNDILWGSNGNDTIDGGTGDDSIFGGTGSDTLTGGTGADIFQFTATAGSDVITDFDFDFDVSGDTIKLYYQAEDNHTNANLSLANGVLTWDVDTTNNDVLIDLSATTNSSDLNDLDALISFVEIV